MTGVRIAPLHTGRTLLVYGFASEHALTAVIKESCTFPGSFAPGTPSTGPTTGSGTQPSLHHPQPLPRSSCHATPGHDRVHVPTTRPGFRPFRRVVQVVPYRTPRPLPAPTHSATAGLDHSSPGSSLTKPPHTARCNTLETVLTPICNKLKVKIFILIKK